MIEKGTKILAIDYGDKRLGLAIAEFGSIAVPLDILQNEGDKKILENLNNIAQQEDIKIFVVGLPNSFSGNTNERLEKTQKFVDFLKESLSQPVYTVDEQLTSKMYSKMGVKKDIDKYSATAILDTFLSQKHGY